MTTNNGDLTDTLNVAGPKPVQYSQLGHMPAQAARQLINYCHSQ